MQERVLLTLRTKPATKNPTVQRRRVHLFVCNKDGKTIINPGFIEMLYRRLRDGDLKHLAPAFGRMLPLHLQVQKDLQRRLDLQQRWPDFNKIHRHNVVFALLRIHTRRPEYLRAVAAPSSQRHDLDGKPIEPVSAEHRAYTLEKITGARK